jgi:nucleoside-diphosphate-sugar epimerase
VPFDEEAPLRDALYPYRGSGRDLDDYEKILVERVTRTAAAPTTVLRLPMVYGERDYQRRLFLELKRMNDRRPAIIMGRSLAGWRWTRGYVDNIAAAIALASTDERAAGRVYNLGDEHALTYADWVRAVGRAAKWDGVLEIVPDDEVPAQLRPPPGDYEQHLVADTSRVRRELGFEDPVSLELALEATVAWERSNEAGNGRPIDYAIEDALLRERGAKI